MSATTVEGLLDAAERMTQSRGYNGVSFRDLAAAVGVKSASVHYYFPTKGQLGAALARRYTDRLLAHLAKLDATGKTPADALGAYVDVFRTILREDGKMCLCGILAAETDAIPLEVQSEVARFVSLNVDWIAATLARASGKKGVAASDRNRARAIFAALEGAMLVARGSGDLKMFDQIVSEFKRSGILESARS